MVHLRVTNTLICHEMVCASGGFFSSLIRLEKRKEREGQGGEGQGRERKGRKELGRAGKSRERLGRAVNF